MDKINLSRPMYVHKCTDLFLQNHATCRLICISNLLLHLHTPKFLYSVAIDKGQINIFLLSNYGTRV